MYVFRLQEVGNQMDGLVVDEKRAERRLLSLQVVRWQSVSGRREVGRNSSAKNVPVAAPAPAGYDRPRSVFEDAAIPMRVVAVNGAVVVAVPIARSRLHQDRGVRVGPLPSAVVAVVVVAVTVPPGMHVQVLPMAPAVVPPALMMHRALIHP